MVRSMTGNEFIRRVRRIGRERGVTVRLDTERGKGSHATRYYGRRFRVVKDRRKEIGASLRSAIGRVDEALRALGKEHVIETRAA